MKKVKLSWKHFLIVVLAILILIGISSVIKNYSNNSEGMENNVLNCPNKVTNTSSKILYFDCSGGYISKVNNDASHNSVTLSCVKPPKEAFANMTLNSSPLRNNPLPCIDPLLPYEKNNCGPIDINKFFFDEIEFKPECCPSTYSSSMGCACMCPEQLTYLNSRAGNRNFPTMY